MCPLSGPPFDTVDAEFFEAEHRLRRCGNRLGCGPLSTTPMAHKAIRYFRERRRVLWSVRRLRFCLVPSAPRFALASLSHFCRVLRRRASPRRWSVPSRRPGRRPAGTGGRWRLVSVAQRVSRRLSRRSGPTPASRFTTTPGAGASRSVLGHSDGRRVTGTDPRYSNRSRRRTSSRSPR